MAKMLNSPITEGKIRQKKFIPGVIIEDNCPAPKCKGASQWAGSLTYPAWGRNAVFLECPLCHAEWTVDIELTLTAKIAPKKKV